VRHFRFNRPLYQKEEWVVEKHFLVTVSEQKSAFYGVRFMGHLFSNKGEMRVTLFYTAPRPPAVWEGERTHESVAESERQAKKYDVTGRDALETAKKELVKWGFKQERIRTRFQVGRFSKVEDIIREGAQGLYDAVILGRRGLSLLEIAFDESITKKLLKEKINFPIWICRMPDLERKNVLVCVDGSEPSSRITDHVGFILGKEKSHVVTLLVVKGPGGKLKEGPENILSKSKEILLSNGFPSEMAKTKVIEAGNVSHTILKEAEQGKFAVVALGRTGAGQGLLKNIFMGSVSNTLFHELKGAALWVCQ
jgi:nucleotide-binding universal stress UspA family protein